MKSGGYARCPDGCFSMTERVISTVETHTGAEPFRIVTSGIPRAPGHSIVAKRQWLKEHHDDIRKSLILEPRGHPDMYGGYLVDPVTSKADFGVIFIHNEGYSDHCGHGVIALATTAVKLGWVERVIPETTVCIDAPCGVIKAYVAYDGTSVGKVKFTNVPSFIWLEDACVETESFGKVSGDIAFGGAFYFYVSGIKHNISIDKSNVETITSFGDQVLAAANEKYSVAHPEVPEINKVYGTIIDNHSGGTKQRNVCVFADRQVDRSPTGSGTAGRMAQLYFRGLLRLHEEFENESIIGSVFRGRVSGITRVGTFDSVIPEVEGNARILGYANWCIERDDEISKGFLVR